MLDAPLFRLSGYFHPRKGELLLDDIAFRHSMRGDDDDEDDGDHNDKKYGDEDQKDDKSKNLISKHPFQYMFMCEHT